MTHGNLLHNEALIRAACAHTEDSAFVGWLPFYHDMGLIGNILQPLYLGSESTLLSPIAFLQKPVRWLSAITRFRAATSGGPNFAYEYCVRRVTAEERAGLDLRSWTLAFNGAEPIRAETQERFTATFRAHGFNPVAFCPVYGLAEATLMVSASRRESVPVTRRFDSKRLGCGEARPADDEAAGRTLVSSGRPVEGQRQTVAIIDPEMRTACADGSVGEIWISGPSVADGYWNRPIETGETFRATRADEAGPVYLRTGDLGFMLDGELFVTGRLKDLIIIRGQNHYPQDIELTVERSHAALRAGGGAAFGLDVGGHEGLGIVHEIERAYIGRPLDEVVREIRRAVAGEHEVEPYAVLLIPPGRLPKTSSGKVRRAACRKAFESGRLEALVRDIRPVSIGDVPLDGFEAVPPGAKGAPTRAQVIQRLIADLLGAPDNACDPDQLIREFGLDSLRIMELRHRVEKTFALQLPVTLRLDEMTIQDVAHAVVHKASPPDAPAAPPPVHVARPEAGFIPASEGQRGLWLLDQIENGGTAYNICRAVRITGPLNAIALRGAFQEMWREHSVLRSRFRMDGSSVIRSEHAGDSWLELDETLRAEQEVTEQLRREEAHRFSLKNGPLFRVLLFTLGHEDHVLVLNMHHIIADLASVGILLREFITRYSAAVGSTTATMPAERIDFADYVRWQANLLAGAEGEHLEQYWRTELAPPIVPLALPYDRPHPASPRLEGRTRDFQISADLLASLRAVTNLNRVTLFSALLAVFNVVMHRLTRQEDIVVGVPCSGRSRSELAAVVGYLVNLTPVRVRLSPDARFDDLMRRVHGRVQSALAHQDYPFAAMVERMPGMRNAVNTLLTLQSFPSRDLSSLAPLILGLAGGEARLDDATTMRSMALRERGAQFDLGMFLTEHDGRLLGTLAYSADVFDEASADRIVRSFLAMIEHTVRAPESTIAELIGLSREEQRQLRAWNRTTTDHRAPESLVVCIEATCNRVPDAPAVSDARLELTYRELNAHANQLARHLATLGVWHESVVGVCLPRSVELEVALLATLKAGAAFLPLDPLEPALRLRAMIEVARPDVVVTSQALAGRLPGGVPICAIDADATLVGRCDASNPQIACLPEQSAYVLFTSGSSGQPKGVVNTHGGLRNRLLWMQDAYGLRTGDRVLQKTPCTFDVSVWEFFMPLLSGASIVMARPEGHRDTAYLAETLQQERVTTVHFVPSQLRVLLRDPALAVGSLRRVICSGESLTQDLQDEFFLRLPGVELHNLYGPTEAAIDVTAWRCKAGVPVTIGRPIANTCAYILDANLNPLPPGVAGELCVGGIALARGYAHRPDLTADRFVPHPLDEDGGERLYRTGDLARWTPDGTLAYLGRLDTQVKVRGARVELGEIEAALRALPGVRDAAVIAEDGPSGPGELSAFIMSDSDTSLFGWRSGLRERLPDYMMPSTLVRLEELPLTRSGKLDRRALRHLAATSGSASNVKPADERPWTPLEKQLAQVWSEILKRNVGIHDNFFELGGHSLLATQLVSRIRDSLHCEIPVALIFSEGVTVAGLAARIEQMLLDDADEIVTASLIERVSTASDEEVRALLADSTESR